MKVGHVIIAIAFNRKNANDPAFENMFYRARQIDEQNVQVEFYAMRVIEELGIPRHPYGEKVVNAQGYLLEDQYGQRWCHNWPELDITGTGLNFSRVVDSMSLEALEAIAKTNALHARAASNVLASLILESYNFTRKDRHLEIPQLTKDYNYKWLYSEFESYVKQIESQLFVKVERKPAFDDAKINIEQFSKFDFVPLKLSSMDVLNALAMFGDKSNHPQVLMRNMDKTLAIITYRNLKHVSPTNTFDLLVPEVTNGVQTIVDNLRAMYQQHLAMFEKAQKTVGLVKGMLDDGAKRSRQEEEARLRRAGPEFIKNNIVDYGNETVAQIAARLGISKSEVRRRKQAGEPL